MQASEVFSINRVFFHKLHHPPCCLSNFPDYGLQFHEDDRNTRSQSQNEEGLSSIPSRDFPWDLGTNFLTEASAKVW